MIADAASSHGPAAARFAVSASTPANFAGSSGSPITPVEARNTSFGLQSRIFATRSAEIFVVSRPRLPVKALALPELTSSARALPDFSAALHQSTGADGQRDVVKTPATVVPLSKTARSTSRRFLYLIPASAAANRTPPIAGRFGKAAGASGETAVIVALIPLATGRAPVPARLPEH